MTLARDYAQALVNAAHTAEKESTKAEPKKLVAQLVKHLETTGRMKLLPHIVRELGRLEAQEKKLAPQVEVAHQKDAAHALAAAAKHGIHANEARVNHTLVQGWRASSKGTLLDASAKRQLVELYKKVLTH